MFLFFGVRGLLQQMLSIIIPTWNEEKYLPKLLDCIKKQTYKNYEIIVADANSKDRTRQIAKKYGCKVVKGGLPAVGRNNGARAAKGDILLFMDADCVIKKDFLRKVLTEFKNRNLEVAGCYLSPISDKLSHETMFGIYNLWIFATQFFYRNASGHTIICSKKLHEKIKGFDEDITLSEDMDYVKRAGKHGKFRIFKNVKVFTSVRRFESEGKLITGLKLFFSAVYRILFGEIKTNIFNYSYKYKK